MGRYMTGLFKLAHDPSSGARKGVCTGLVQLLHLQPERLAPHLPDIIEYMLRSMQARPDGTLFAIPNCHTACAREPSTILEHTALAGDLMGACLYDDAHCLQV